MYEVQAAENIEFRLVPAQPHEILTAKTIDEDTCRKRIALIENETLRNYCTMLLNKRIGKYEEKPNPYKEIAKCLAMIGNERTSPVLSEIRKLLSPFAKKV